MLHENFSDEVNAAHDESELRGGARLDELAVGKKLVVRTKNTVYTIERRGDGLYIQGHPKYCPVPVKCRIPGSVYSREGSMLRMNFIGRGMFMEFRTDEHPSPIVTSEIQEVTEV
jgi:hypothetical protein